MTPKATLLRLDRMRQLRLDPDLHLLTHHDSARLERLVPVQPEVAAVDSRLRADADPVVAPRIDLSPLVRRVQRHLAGRPANRQGAHHPELVRDVTLDPRADEPHRR